MVRSSVNQRSRSRPVGDRLRLPLEQLAAVEGGSLLLLRAFLGVTFVFAGLQKLANPDFLSAAAPGSFPAQLHAAMGSSPIGPLLRVVAHAPTPVALAIAVGELVVGVATLLGCLGRIAAFGGFLLSTSFFLTVSYATSPYYFGSDIVFMFAWTPLVIAGSGALSLDRLWRLPAGSVAGERPDALERRALLGRIGIAALIALLAGATATLGRARHRSASTPSTTVPRRGGAGPVPTTTPGVAVESASDLAVGSATAFSLPSGEPGFVVHPSEERFRAFSAVCTHAGCTVAFAQSVEQFACPCHGSRFDAATGAVLSGPAQAPLPEYPVAVSSTGQLVVEA